MKHLEVRTKDKLVGHFHLCDPLPDYCLVGTFLFLLVPGSNPYYKMVANVNQAKLHKLNTDEIH